MVNPCITFGAAPALNELTVFSIVRDGSALLAKPAPLSQQDLDRVILTPDGALEVRYLSHPRAPDGQAPLLQYAAELAQRMYDKCPDGLLQAPVTESLSKALVCTKLVLRVAVADMSDAQRREFVRFVVSYAQAFLSVVFNGDIVSGFPGAQYHRATQRMMEAVAAQQDRHPELWVIKGRDTRFNDDGVLELCVGEPNAQESLRLMNRFPERFLNLTAEPYLN